MVKIYFRVNVYFSDPRYFFLSCFEGSILENISLYQKMTELWPKIFLNVNHSRRYLCNILIFKVETNCRAKLHNFKIGVS